jgi:hypothetical protein
VFRLRWAQCPTIAPHAKGPKTRLAQTLWCYRDVVVPLITKCRCSVVDPRLQRAEIVLDPSESLFGSAGAEYRAFDVGLDFDCETAVRRKGLRRRAECFAVISRSAVAPLGHRPRPAIGATGPTRREMQ